MVAPSGRKHVGMGWWWWWWWWRWQQCAENDCGCNLL